ncbi:MAG: hypothetical protein GVY26_16675 [Bacteroidetes bacterium]|jgi:tetratricopeptide (TPR) repeat protein|nr:hypothetical protein [Bacteroidota bacterium]
MRALLFIVLLSLPLGAWAQEDIMAFINNKYARRFEPQPVEGYKYEIAKQVFQRLLKANGANRMPPSKLVMNDGRRYMAWMQASTREIGIEEQAYDICASLGKDSLNALAALLSHELVHYYEKHNWKRHFVSQDDLARKTAEQGKAYEEQADYFGGILALSAGFNTYRTLSPLLNHAYERYGLPEQIKGYPSLSERLQISQNTAERLRGLYQVYQTANLLVLIGAYEQAVDYYDYILGEYQGYELYNNSGANALLAALELYEPKEMPFVLPVELDLRSRLAQLGTRLAEEKEARRRKLLEQAQLWLKSALSLDEQNTSVQLNLSILHLLRQEWLDAEYRAKKGKALAYADADSSTVANADLILGTMAALQGDTAQAVQWFAKAKRLQPALAAANLSALDGSTDVQDATSEPVKGVEQIEAILPEDFLFAEPDYQRTINLAAGIYSGFKPVGQSQVLLHYDETGPYYAFFHQTQEGYTGQSLKGIQLGDRKTDIVKAYGPPSRLLMLSQGQCLAYDQWQLLFLLDAKERLERWVVFRKELPEQN